MLLTADLEVSERFSRKEEMWCRETWIGGHGGDGLGFVLVILEVFPNLSASMAVCLYESSITAASRSGRRSAAPMLCAHH